MQERKDKWTVGEWMTDSPEVIAPKMLARDAFIKMKTEGFRHLLVMEDDKLLGIISDRDLRRPDLPGVPYEIDDFYRLDEEYEVGDIMTVSVRTVNVSDKIESAIGAFLDNKYGALPVLNKKGLVVGIITLYDAIMAFDEAMRVVRASQGK